MKNLLCVGTAAATFVLYVGVIAFGARLGMEGLALSGRPVSKSTLWHVEPLNVGGSAARLETIQFGSQLFNETPIYGSTYVKSRISCSNCHLQGGTAPYASPVVGIVPSFPMFSKRAGRKITLEDRVQECMTRSENGRPLPSDSHEMKALLAYINWLSEPHIGQKDFVGRGLEVLPSVRPDPSHGAAVYSSQCAGCHGVDGEGTRRPFPPLWGPNSFNDGAGMNGIEKMAAFVQYNMPHNRKGILSTQDAFDVAAYVHDRPRPAFNPAYDHF
jgi:thiosulfate dehydrogenase